LIKHLTYKQIDHKKWDECINKAFNGRVYALSWYLDEIAYGWEALVEEDYTSVMPLPGGKKAGINYLFQPFFTQQLGLFSIGLLTPEQINNFLEAIPSKYRYGELNLNSHNNPSDDHRYKLTYNSNHELDLIKPYPSIQHSFSENTRRNIKKSHNQGIIIAKNSGPEELVALFSANRGALLNHITDAHYSRLIALMHKAIYNNTGFISACYQHNNLLCGAFFLNFRNRLVFLFSAISEEGKKNGAMFFLLDETIRQFAEKPVILDFEGSNEPNLARFYKSFGANEVKYPRIVFNRLPYPLQITVNVAKKLRQIISF